MSAEDSFLARIFSLRLSASRRAAAMRSWMSACWDILGDADQGCRLESGNEKPEQNEADKLSCCMMATTEDLLEGERPRKRLQASELMFFPSSDGGKLEIVNPHPNTRKAGECRQRTPARVRDWC